MVQALDPRLTPARADIAASHLQGVVDAQRYVDGAPRRTSASVAAIRRAPELTAMRETELLFGEEFTVYEQRDDGWCWGQAQRDGYVGYVFGDDLSSQGAPPTHRVGVRATFVFSEPNLKSAPLMRLSFGAQLCIDTTNGDWAALNGGGFVWPPHLAPLDAPATDWVGEAQRFLGAPYLWGGRSADGLDCSGLIQLALQAADINAPRDADMQERALGAPAAGAPQRGDLVFWRGHVGVMLDGQNLLHANAHHMATAIEPLTDAVARIGAAGHDVTSRRRL